MSYISRRSLCVLASGQGWFFRKVLNILLLVSRHSRLRMMSKISRWCRCVHTMGKSCRYREGSVSGFTVGIDGAMYVAIYTVGCASVDKTYVRYQERSENNITPIKEGGVWFGA